MLLDIDKGAFICSGVRVEVGGIREGFTEGVPFFTRSICTGSREEKWRKHSSRSKCPEVCEYRACS